MTDVAIAATSVATIAATILTAGSAGPAVGSLISGTSSSTGLSVATSVAANATLSTITSTMITSALQTSLNAKGDIFNQIKDITKDTIKETISKENIKNYLFTAVTTALTSGLTTGITNKLNTNIRSNEFTKALKESVASSLANSTVESTMNGKSFKDMLKDQLTTSLIMVGANIATKEIGSNYHEGNINKGTQLFLHGVTGAVTSKILGNDMTSGAVSSIIGEVTGELLGENTKLSDDALKEIGGLAGGLSALVTGGLRGLSSEEISSNIFNSQRLGKNAVENNYLLKTGQVEKGDTLKSITKEINDFYGTNLTEEDLVKINAIADENNLTIGDVIAVGTVGENGEVWRVPYDKNEVNLDYLKNNMKGEKEKILNYHRFVFEDDDLPQTENELLKKEKNSWEGGKVAPAHNVGTSGNIEYRGIGNRTGQQIIFDKNGNIVTTPENKGTYDYVVPKVKVTSPLDTYKSLKNHNLYDVNPWIKYGNSAKDKSTKQQRKDGLRENKAGKVGNMMWGDD